MPFSPTLITVFDSPIGFTTDAICAEFDGVVYGLDGLGAAISCPVKAYENKSVAFSQISAATCGAFGVAGRLWAMRGSSETVMLGNATAGDAMSNAANGVVAVENLGFNGLTWDRMRVPAWVVTGTATASGNTALRSPASGKKFRVLRAMIQMTQDSSLVGGANVDIQLYDGVSTPTGIAWSVYVPTLASALLGQGSCSPWMDLGNGYLSVAANNALNIRLSATISGKVRVVVAGDDE